MGLASILVRMGLDLSGYATGMKRAESMTNAWGRRMASSLKGHLAATFSVAAVTAATRHVLQYADTIDDISNRIGVSAKTIQEWTYAASQTGTTVDAFARSFTYLARKFPEKSSDQILDMFNGIADSVKNGGLGQNEMSTVVSLLGRGATELIPAFKSGLSGMASEASNLGLVLKDEVVDALAQVGDQIEILKLQFTGLGAEGLAKFLKDASDAIDAVGMADKAVQQFFGALLGGGGLSGAYGALMASKQDTGMDIQKREAAIAAIRERSNASRAFRSEDATGAGSTTVTSKWSASSLTANQQVGAFVAAQPIVLTEIKEQTKVLRDIRKLAESIDDKS